MVLRILYACTRCGLVVNGGFYDLRQMFGEPAICLACAKARR